MTIACTCRSEANDLFPRLCRANYHHWEEMLKVLPGAKITWNEDFVSQEDDVCHCKACRP